MSENISDFSNNLSNIFTQWSSDKTTDSNQADTEPSSIMAQDSVSFSGDLMDQGSGIGKSTTSIEQTQDHIESVIEQLDTIEVGSLDNTQVQDLQNAIKTIQTQVEQQKATASADTESLDQASQLIAEAQKSLNSLIENTEGQDNVETALNQVSDLASSIANDIEGVLENIQANESTEASNTDIDTASSDTKTIEDVTATIDQAIATFSDAIASSHTNFFEDLELKISVKALENAKERIEDNVQSDKSTSEVAEDAIKELETLIEQGKAFKKSWLTGKDVDAVLDVVVTDLQTSLDSIESERATAQESTPPDEAEDSAVDDTSSPLSSEEAQSILDEIAKVQEAIETPSQGENLDQAIADSTASLQSIRNILDNSSGGELVDSLGKRVDQALAWLDSASNPAPNPTHTMSEAEKQQVLDTAKEKLSEAKGLLKENGVTLNLIPDLLGEANDRVESLKLAEPENTVDKVDLSSIGKGLIERTSHMTGAYVSENGSVTSVDQDSMLGAMGDQQAAERATAKATSRYESVQKAGVNKAGSATAGKDRIDIGNRGEAPGKAKEELSPELKEQEETSEVEKEKKAIDMEAAMEKAGSRIETQRTESLEKSKIKAEIEAKKIAITREAEKVIAEGAKRAKEQLLSEASSGASLEKIQQASDQILSDGKLMQEVIKQVSGMVENGMSKEDVTYVVQENIAQQINIIAR